MIVHTKTGRTYDDEEVDDKGAYLPSEEDIARLAEMIRDVGYVNQDGNQCGHWGDDEHYERSEGGIDRDPPDRSPVAHTVDDSRAYGFDHPRD